MVVQIIFFLIFLQLLQISFAFEKNTVINRSLRFLLEVNESNYRFYLINEMIGKCKEHPPVR